MRKAYQTLILAFLSFTRLPMPRLKQYDETLMKKTIYFFPFIGLVIGGMTAGIYSLANLCFGQELSLIISMISSIYITGAFHEDGFADFCDGFGGGYTKERIFEIMKDSCIGTYGAVGLGGILALKFFALYEIESPQMVAIIIAGHILSRCIPIVMTYTLPYVRPASTSKFKHMKEKKSAIGLVITILFLGLSLLFISPYSLLFFMACMLPVFIIFSLYIKKKIGGYTGDILGALQQMAEVVFYLSFIIFSTL